MNNPIDTSLLADFTGPSMLRHAKESYGLERANSRTHKAFLRKNHLGKFKKNKAR